MFFVYYPVCAANVVNLVLNQKYRLEGRVTVLQI